MVRSFRAFAVLLAVLVLLTAAALPAAAQTVYVAGPAAYCAPPVVSYYAPPVVSYYAPPAVSYYAAPAVSYYAAPAVSYYAAPAVSYYAAPAVSYYAAPPVRYYASPGVVTTTYRYGLLPGRRVTTSYYYGP